MKSLLNITKTLAVMVTGLFAMAILGVIVAGGAYMYFGPKVPDASEIGGFQFSEPLRIYTADGKLIAKYGLKHRIPVDYEQLPKVLIHAFVAAEDDRFFEHPGVDYQGLLRAAWNLLITGTKSQGGSTITMQLARNLYLSPKQTFVRKFKEIILALRIESVLTKKQILQLYLNKIYLGNGAYGVGAAARIYFGKKVSELSLSEAATLAGLPKAPSYYNPAAYPERARERRAYVLRRMHELDYITDRQYQTALAKPVETVTQGIARESFEADYVAAMARQFMVERYGESAYSAGYTVITTIQSDRQGAANQALRHALIAYDQRHEWRGAESTVPTDILDEPKAMNEALAARPEAGDLIPAIVLNAQNDHASLYMRRHGKVRIGRDDVAWLDNGEAMSALINAGDQVRLMATHSEDQSDAWELVQIPEVQGALVALKPRNGAIVALVGGFDFSLSQFNRVTQAYRQTGSAFKPFIYSAALANGFTAASMINDAPVVYDLPGVDYDWRPQNYSGDIRGPTRLRVGLVHSINLVTIRLLSSIGIATAIDFIERFGLPTERLPRDLSMALGSGTFTPLQLASGYAVFANGGYRIDPFFIQEVRTDQGKVVYSAKPEIVCDNHCKDVKNPAERTVPAANIYIMNSILHDVILHGTGSAARRLGRSDLHGKTGTTDQQRDAWFAGYNHALVTVAWVGFDGYKPLGWGETGAQAALPMWIEFMDQALEGVPSKPIMPRPDNIVSVRINPETGTLAQGPGGIFELFRKGHVPEPANDVSSNPNGASGGAGVERLF